MVGSATQRDVLGMDKTRIAVQPVEQVVEAKPSTESTAHAPDRPTGFGDRHKLITDLTHALKPGSPPSVLAVFQLAGWYEHRRVFGVQASEELTTELAEAFALVVRPVGAYYYIPREGEFCALISQPIDDATSTLFAAEAALNDDAGASLITASFGATYLPDEAADPIEALTLADERLGLHVLSPKPRERRRAIRES